jgi:hypothetical protein
LTPLLYRLGQFCARHPVWILAVWLVIALAIVGVARSVGQETNDNLSLPGTDSQAASNLLGDKFPDQANGSVPIAFRAPAGTKLSDTRYKKPIERVTRAYSKDPAVTQTVGPFDEQGADQLNKKHTIGYISLNLKDSPSKLSIEEAQRIIKLGSPLEKAGLDPAAGGYLGQKVSKPSTHVPEVVGLTAAVFILLFTFGTAIAMGIPILTAILGLSAGLGLIALISHTAEVPTSAPTLATMIGLGIGIDYALFIVTRHRSQLAEGMEPRESSARATATAGGAVVFAGGTVIIALLSLAAAGIPLVTTLGYTTAIVVVVAASAATTLLPAILGLIGLYQPPARAWHTPTPRPASPWLGPMGRLRRLPSLAGPDSWARCAAAPRRPRAIPSSRPDRHRSLARGHSVPPVLRHDDQRVRTRLERSYAHSGEPLQAGPQRQGRRRQAAQPAAEGHAARDRQTAGQGGGEDTAASPTGAEASKTEDPGRGRTEAARSNPEDPGGAKQQQEQAEQKIREQAD